MDSLKKQLGVLGVLVVGAFVSACGDDEAVGGGGASSTSGTGLSGSTGSGLASGSTSQSSTSGPGSTTASSSASTGGPSWQAPACNAVTGTPAVTFTNDEGATLASTMPLSGTGYTSLAALDVPNRLIAEHKGTVLVSEDAGCTWAETDTLASAVYRMVAGRGGVAYAFADNGPQLYRIDADGNATMLDSGAEAIVGLGVDPANGMHVRVGEANGGQRDSVDGGATWTKHGTPGAVGNLVLGYRYAYDPADLDHVLYGQATEGAQISTDGGMSWTDVTGIGKRANAFNIAVSPADGNVVWIESLEVGPDARHIYRSEDGGHTFVSVVDETPEIDLINGNLLAPHGSDPNVLYFVYGSYFQAYGTDLYRYDHATGMVTKTHNANDDVSAVVPSPASAEILYLGLVTEEVN